MMKVYVIANQKGGVAKTTTAVNLTTILNSKGQKTLLIDADPQGNSTSTYDAPLFPGLLRGAFSATNRKRHV